MQTVTRLIMKRISAAMCALVLLATLASPLSVVSGHSGSTASLHAYDTTTKGAWNGQYGVNGYILFGYNGGEAPRVEGSEIALYEHDIYKKPAYIDTADNGYMYKALNQSRAWIKTLDASDDTITLDPPAGSDTNKIKVATSRGEGGQSASGLTEGDIQRFTFQLNDGKEHLFTVYVAEYASMKAFAIKAPDGDYLVDFFGGASAYGLLTGVPGYPESGELGHGAYITFKVKGSFTFEYYGSWHEGPSGMFFDPTSDQPPEEEFPSTIAIDRETQGAWNNQYGGDGYILLGYGYTDAVPGPGVFWDKWMHMPSVTHDIKSLPAYISNFNYSLDGDSLWAKASDNTAVSLDKPIGAPDSTKFDVYGGGGFESRFNFTLNDSAVHQFTFYSNADAGNPMDITLVDTQGDIIVPKHSVAKGGFAGGVYMTYFVSGSFSLLVDKVEQDMMWGPQAFFFDTLADNTTIGLSAAYESPRSAKLTWSNSNSAVEVIVERSRSSSDGFSPVATIPAGTNIYIDTDLSVDATYYYRLRIKDGQQYSQASSAVSITVPPYTTVELAFDQDAYTEKETGKTLILNATLTSNGVPVVGKTIIFTLSGQTVSDYLDSALGSAVTSDTGIASLTITPDFMGLFTVTADFTADDADELAPASATANLSIAVNKWDREPLLFTISDAVCPGELINITGAGLNSTAMTDVTVKIKTHTDAAPAVPPTDALTLTVDQTDARDGYFLVARFPKTAAGDVYDVWVSNEYGWSKPLLLNGARPLFASEYEAWDGQTIELSGRNFQASQFGLLSATKVRLNDGGQAVEQRITKLTPYSIRFTVDAPLGTYAIEVSNDKGATWIPLASEQTLTIVAKGHDPLGLGVAWADTFRWNVRFDVTNYGATGADETDDTAAFTAAVAAAKAAGGGVVYIPKGNYHIGRIAMPADVVILGEDRANTILTYNSQSANMFESEGDGQTLGHQGFSGFTIRLKDETKRPDAFFWLGHAWGAEADVSKLRKGEQFFIHNVKLDYTLDYGYPGGMRGYGVVIIAKERFIFLENDFSGWSVGICHAYVNEYSAYRGNTFRYTHEGYVQSTASYFFAVGNHITGDGWKAGSQHETHGIFARARSHMEDNEVYNVGSDINDGETYCVDSPGGNFNMGYVLSATSDTLTAAPVTPIRPDTSSSFSRLSLQIVHGRGMGQIREVAKIEGNKLTLSQPWGIVPDGTSRFSLLSPIDMVTIYNNYAENASKGIYIFGNTADVVVAGNKQVDTEGAFIWTALVNGVLVTASHVTIRDNQFTGVSPKTKTSNISMNTQRYGSQGLYFGIGGFHVEIRNNTMIGDKTAIPNNLSEAPPESGLVIWSGHKSSEPINDGYNGDATNVLIEGNILTDYNHGVSLTHGNYGVILKNNTFYDVTEELYLKAPGEPENLVHITGNAPVNKSILQELIEQQKGRFDKAYTEDTWKKFENTLNNAESVWSNLNATILDIQNALAELDEAVLLLEFAEYAPVKTIVDSNHTGVTVTVPRVLMEVFGDNLTLEIISNTGPKTDITIGDKAYTIHASFTFTLRDSNGKAITAALPGAIRFTVPFKGSLQKDYLIIRNGIAVLDVKYDDEKLYFNTSHLSTFDIATLNETLPTPSGSETMPSTSDPKSPSTGDNTHWIIFLITGLGLFGVFLTLKKRSIN